MAKKLLDKKDLAIVSAFNEYGATTPIKELSKNLNIPSRTIRHRLARLIENGLINSYYPMIHERKLGLGDSIILLEQISSKLTEDFLKQISCFYWIFPTFGTINGFQINALYPAAHPNYLEDLILALKVKKLIGKYYILHIVDYNLYNVNLSYFDPKTLEWTWSWENWVKNLVEIISRDQIRNQSELFRIPEVQTFDSKDIEILRFLKSVSVRMDGSYGLQSFTLRQIAQNIDLTEPYIKRRIKKMENKGIIKDYYVPINILSEEDRILVFFYFESSRPLTNLLHALTLLPFGKNISFESYQKASISIYLSATDLSYFLSAMNKIRTNLTNFGIQFIPNFSTVDHHGFKHYNESTQSWDIPFDDYKKVINKIKV